MEPNDELYEGFEADWTSTVFDPADMIEDARPELILEGCTTPKRPSLSKSPPLRVYTCFWMALCAAVSMIGNVCAKPSKIGDLCLHVVFQSATPPSWPKECYLNGDLGEIVSVISTHPHKLRQPAYSWYFDPNA